MMSHINFTIVLSLIVCAHWLKELEASRQVVLTCGSDEAGEKGSQGPPGKRGPIGVPGSNGEKGSAFFNLKVMFKNETSDLSRLIFSIDEVKTEIAFLYSRKSRSKRRGWDLSG